MVRPRLLALLAASCLALNAQATTLIYDDFGIPSDPNANLDGRTPVTGPNDWEANTGGIDAGWKVYGGVALLGTASTGNGLAGIDMGSANYFANNPGVYSLKAQIQMPDATAGWYAIGFSQGIATSAGRGYYQSGVVQEGEPWMFVRNTGEVNVRPNATFSAYSDFPTLDISDFEIELVLDTSVTNWTVAAYVDGVQLDLDSGSSSMLFTYSTNRTEIQYVGMNATNTAVGSVSSFSLTTVPEPQTYALILGAACLAFGLIRRRR